MFGKVQIEASGGGAFDAYLAGDGKTGKRPAIIVLQEIFGVNAGIRAKADHWAGAGYLAMAPDLFWRSEPNVQLDPELADDWQRAIALMQASKIDNAVADIETTIHALRARPECEGKVGVVGYCWGGLLAFLSATRTDASACVSYYGGGIDQRLVEVQAIAKPLLLHFGEADAYIPAAARDAIAAALTGNTHATTHVYSGADHAFARENGAHRDEAAAALADQRTDAFFAAHLRQQA